MWIDQDTLQEVNIQYPYKGFSRLDTPEIRGRARVVEIPDPQPPQEAIENPEYYIESPTGDGSPPYKVWVRRDEKCIAEAHNATIRAKIATAEAGQARALREAVLSGDTARLTALDLEIRALRKEFI